MATDNQNMTPEAAKDFIIQIYYDGFVKPTGSQSTADTTMKTLEDVAKFYETQSRDMIVALDSYLFGKEMSAKSQISTGHDYSKNPPNKLSNREQPGLAEMMAFATDPDAQTPQEQLQFATEMRTKIWDAARVLDISFTPIGMQPPPNLN